MVQKIICSHTLKATLIPIQLDQVPIYSAFNGFFLDISRYSFGEYSFLQHGKVGLLFNVLAKVFFHILYSGTIWNFSVLPYTLLPKRTKTPDNWIFLEVWKHVSIAVQFCWLPIAFKFISSYDNCNTHPAKAFPWTDGMKPFLSDKIILFSVLYKIRNCSLY